MEAVMGVLLGIGLGAACGFRIFVPLLVASIAIHGGFLTVTPEFAWLGGTPALITLSIATLLEIAGYYLPVIDNTLDVLGAPAAVIAGTILAAGFIGHMDPMLQWGLAAHCGRRSGGRHSWRHGGHSCGGLRHYGRTGKFRGLHGGNGIRLPCLHPGLRAARSSRPPAGSGIYLLVRFAISLKRKLAQAGTPDKVEVQD